MGALWEWLEGKKTYLIAAISAFVAANGVLGWIPEEVMTELLALLAALGFATLRLGLSNERKRIEAKLTR